MEVDPEHGDAAGAPPPLFSATSGSSSTPQTATAEATATAPREGACGPCRCGTATTSTKTPTPVEFVNDREKERHGLRSLGEELQCAICKELFVEASTLECGHSFCGLCIEAWLKRDLSCPICRRSISRAPTRSMCLDKTVEILVQMAEEESRKTLQERRSKCIFKREKECAAQREMESLLARAARAGVRVVTISKPWSEREQSRFLRGIEHHQGIAREAFCGLVGLTHQWVGRASREELIVAARNVGLDKSSVLGAGAGWVPEPAAPDPTSVAPAPPTAGVVAPASASASASGPSGEAKPACLAKLRARLDMYISVG